MILIYILPLIRVMLFLRVPSMVGHLGKCSNKKFSSLCKQLFFKQSFTVVSDLGDRVEQFAQIYAAKLGIKENILRKVLWGDYYLEPKTKRLLQYKHLKGRQLKPMFVQFVLENIWAIYDAVIINKYVFRLGKKSVIYLFRT